MSYPLTFIPPVALHSDHRPTSAACTGDGCRWSQTEPSESPDMQSELLRKATAHALDCESEVTITAMSVLTVIPVPRG